MVGLTFDCAPREHRLVCVGNGACVYRWSAEDNTGMIWTVEVVDSSGQCPLCSRLLFEEAEETMMKAGAS